MWFTTSHPSNMEDRTLETIGRKETIVKRLHLPVQTGSDRMLKVMHRGYKSDRYRRKIEVFRENVPDGTLSTDIIVGHPGETDQDHEQTLRLVEDCGFDSAYIFKFSPRSGTEAAKLPAGGAGSRDPEAVRASVARRRAERLLPEPGEDRKCRRRLYTLRTFRRRQGHRRDLGRPRSTRRKRQEAGRVRGVHYTIRGAPRAVCYPDLQSQLA